jgi:hypothetical protein
MRSVTKDGFTLTLSVVQGTLGEPKNSFEILQIDNKGFKIHYPFYPPIKVRKVTGNSLIFYLDKFSDKELTKMLEQQIILLTNPNKGSMMSS